VKRLLVVGLAMGMLLAISSLAFAETTSPAELTPQVEQTRQTGPTDRIAALEAEIMEGRKELIRKQVEAGLITQEQADRILNRLEKRAAQAEKTKPTAEERKELAEAYRKQLQLHKELIKEKVKVGIITPEQGRNQLRRLERLENFGLYRQRMLFQRRQDRWFSNRGPAMDRGLGRGMWFGRGRGMIFDRQMNRDLIQRYRSGIPFRKK